jgi:hypothetical protein
MIPMPEEEDYEVPGRPAMSKKLLDLACAEWVKTNNRMKKKELTFMDSFGNT